MIPLLILFFPPYSLLQSAAHTLFSPLLVINLVEKEGERRMEKKREALCPYFSGAADAQGRAQNLSFLPWEREAFKAGRQTHFFAILGTFSISGFIWAEVFL